MTQQQHAYRNHQASSPTLDYLGTYPAYDTARDALRRAVVASNRGEINLCTPATTLPSLLPLHALVIAHVPTDGVELYKLPGGGSGFGIPKVFLDRLKEAAKLQVVSNVRTDGLQHDDYWQFECTLVRPDLTGGSVQIVKAKTVDFRQGAPDLAAFKGDGQITQARINGASYCESKALNRAVREALGIRAMLPNDFQRPWVVVTLVPYVQAQDLSPAARETAALHLVTASSLLYGKRPSPPPALPASPVPAHLPAPAKPAPAPAETSAPSTQAPAAADQAKVPSGPPDFVCSRNTTGRDSPATDEQIAGLSKAYDLFDELGADFGAVARQALGRDLPPPEHVTQAEAQTVLTAARAFLRARPTGGNR